MTTQPMPKAYYQYMLELQTVDFVLVDLNLYLDTHPNDTKALAQFQQFQKRKHNLVQQYEAAFGPLYGEGVSPVAGDKWTWRDAPWPWQV